MRTARLASLLAASLAFLGCDDSRTSSGPIRASEGGTVIAASHTVDIPANALASDTEVTLETAPASGYPALEGSLAEVLRIEPEGTVLEVPASLTIHGSFVGAASAASVTVRQLTSVDGVSLWSPIESARDAASGDLTVSVTRFAPLAVVVSETPSGAAITGTLRWGDGSPVDGAPVELHQGGSLLTTATTDAAGTFSFADLTPGAYELSIDYECMLTEPVTVAAGAPTEVELTLCAF